jgi:hypothetical protein
LAGRAEKGGKGTENNMTAKHYRKHRLSIPSNREYSIPQLRMMLHEVASILGQKVSDREWNNL